MFATRTTVHTTNRATPAQLVFGRDAILNVQHEADWAYIKERKDKLSRKNNHQENKTRIKHYYQINNEILLQMQANHKYASTAYTGPFTITKVNTNGTVQLKMGCVTNTHNIRNIKPYFD